MRQLLSRFQQPLADGSSHTGQGDILVFGRGGDWDFTGGGSGLAGWSGGCGSRSSGELLDVGLDRVSALALYHRNQNSRGEFNWRLGGRRTMW
jgi:hypothetical protein